MEYRKARELVLNHIQTTGTQRIALEQSPGRVLAERLQAAQDVPSFDRSPYDGYAFRAADTADASREHPVTLQVLEEIPAGAVPTRTVHAMEAVKILTGAPIPPGADAVQMKEKTSFTQTQVTLYAPLAAGSNIIRAGEDVRRGQILQEPGSRIDAGLAGSLAAQGITEPLVYAKPLAGILSVGSELVDPEAAEVPAGKIRNTNRFSFTAALMQDGCDTISLGTAQDSVREIAERIEKGLDDMGCDILFLTGGVSVGDYDLTPEAMERAGCKILFQGADIKPGMACCYGVRRGKPVCALSGNPASSLVNYYVIARPAVRKLAGLADPVPEEFTILLAEGFSKKSKQDRFLKGRLAIEEGRTVLHIPEGQGNTMIGSFTGCDVMALVPADSGPLPAGTQLKAFYIRS